MKNTVWNLIHDLKDKKGINEIIINSTDHIFVEREGEFIKLNTSVLLEDIEKFCQEVAQLNNQQLNAESPILDGSLADGSRVNIIYPPYAVGSAAITIRKYIKSITRFDEHPEVFGLGQTWIKFLKSIVLSRSNIVVSGGTGVGKTTFLNLLLGEVSPNERLVIIEDTIELSIGLSNIVRIESVNSQLSNGPSIREIVKNTLRMRPDRIILGEVRGAEMFDLLQALNTGHEGSMTSIHANSPRDCLSRMENLVLMSKMELPLPVIRRQISRGVDFLIQLERDRNGNRYMSRLCEITGMEGDQLLTQVIVEREEGVLVRTGLTPSSFSRLVNEGGLDKDFFNS